MSKRDYDFVRSLCRLYRRVANVNPALLAEWIAYSFFSVNSFPFPITEPAVFGEVHDVAL